MEPIRSYCSASVGLPLLAVGRLLHCTFRGLLSVYSRYGLHARQVAYATLYTRGSDDFVSSVAALIATGWSEPAPGRDFHPLRTSAFHGAPQTCAMGIFQQLSEVSPVWEKRIWFPKWRDKGYTPFRIPC